MCLTDHVSSDRPLSHQESHLVRPQAVVDSASIVRADRALQHRSLKRYRGVTMVYLQHCNQVVDAVVTDLLHETENTGTEEDLGVAVP